MKTIFHTLQITAYSIISLFLLTATAHAGTLTVQLDPISDTGWSTSDNITFEKQPNFKGMGTAGELVSVSNQSQTLCTATIEPDGTWSCVSPMLNEGVHTITAVLVIDEPESATTTITIDTSNTTPPSAPTVIPAQIVTNSPITTVNTLNIQFTGLAEPGSRVSILNETLNTQYCFVIADAVSGVYNCTGSVPTEGNFSFKARETDLAGNVSEYSESVQLLIDLSGPDIEPPAPTAPSVPVLDPASDTGVSNSDNYTSDTTPTFTGTGTPGSSLYVTAGAIIGGSPVCSTTVAPDGTWSCTSSTLASHPLGVEYYIRAHYSNILGSAPLLIKVDNENRQPTTKPIIKTEFNNGVSDSDDITSFNPFRVRGFAENMVKIDVFINNVFNCAVTSTGGGYWSCLLTVPGPGTYAIDTVETDRAGNLSPRSQTANFTITP